ncbi:hypothetical protein CHUAL_004808 [Chamberlinius hualienensis]
MGNSGSSKVHKAESERLGDYQHPSLQRANAKHYNGGFKVLPERLPNQRLRPTDNGHLLQNGGTLSGRRPTSISGMPDSLSPQPPPLPPPLTEEELTQLLKKRQYHPQQFQRHSIAESGPPDSSYDPSRYISDSTKSDIDFRLSRRPQVEEVSKKKHLFSRKSKAPVPFEGVNAINDERLKKSNKKDFLKKNFNSSSCLDNDQISSIVIPPPSQFSNSDVNAPVKIDSKDKKSIKYVFERREASVSPSTGDQRSSTSAGERNRYIKRENSPSENKYNAGGRINNHSVVHGQLSDGSIHASTIDRSDSRQRMNETLQKRVRSMDSLVHNEIDSCPQRESLNVTKRNEIEERISKMSKQFNQSMDNIYLLSKTNNDIMLMRKPSDLGGMNKRSVPDGPKVSNNSVSKQNLDMNHKSELNLRTNYFMGNVNKDSPRLPDPKVDTPINGRHSDIKTDDDVFDPPDIEFNYNKSDQNKPYLKSKDSRNFLPSPNRHASSESPEIVSEHVQEAFFAKTRETRSGVLEFNRKLGKNQSKRDMSRSSTNENDESSEDDMDIDMQLRPTLPKRHLAVPRFSPTHVWRSLSVEQDGRRINGEDRLSIHSSDAEEEGDVYEDRIHRVARPMAPPRISNEKSADSGISPGAVSPLPVAYDFDINEKSRQTTNKTNTTSSSPSSNNNNSSAKPPPARSSSLTQNNPAFGGVSNVKDRFSSSSQQREAAMDKKNAAWTPEEDLASDFDAGSGEIPIVSVESRQFPSWGPELVSSHPKLTTRKEMFSSKHIGSNDDEFKIASNGHNDDGIATTAVPQTFNSVRKLKRSLSGVLQNSARNKGTGNAANGETNAQTKYTNLDDNWSLSRSLPNSLHNGHESEKLSEYRGPKNTNGESTKATQNKKLPSQNVHNIEKRDVGRAYFQSKLNRSESGPVYFGGAELSPLNSDENHLVQSRPFIDLEGHTFNNCRTSGNLAASSGKNRLMYLPTYEAMEIIDEKSSNNHERKAYSDLGTRTETNIPLAARSSTLTNKGHATHNKNNQSKLRKGKKFTYQSTVRQNERKQLEQKLSKEVALEERRRAEEIALVNKVEEEFQKKRDREKVTIRQQLRILNLKDENGDDIEGDDDDDDDYSETENDDKYSPEHHSLPWDNTRNYLPHNYNGPPSLPLHIPPIDYDTSKPNQSHIKNSTYRDPAPPSTGLFGGISKWIKKPPSKVENGQRNDRTSRLEPEGAPSTLTMQDGNGHNRQPSPQQESRGRAITGSKYSSGRSPDITFGAPRKSIYTQLAQVAEKERQLEKQPCDSRTSVWISPDKTYPSTPSSSKFTPLTANDRSNSYHQLSLNNPEQDCNYYPMGHSSMPYDISNDPNQRLDKDNRSFHGGMLQSHDMLQRGNWKSQGNQRHSIAIDTSSSGRGGGNGGPWVSDGFRNPDGSSNPSNGRSKSPKPINSIPPPSYNNEYSHPNQAQDYRKRQNSPGLNPNHRSLSFSHIPAINEGQSRSSRIMVPTLVQPYNSNKAYRPVPFYSKK